MLKIKVKVGNVSSLSEARYCAGMGVDMLGFSIGGSIDAIDPSRFKEITGWISGPGLVIEWAADTIPDDFATILESYNARIVQIDVRHLGNIPPLDVKWIISVPAGALTTYKADVIRRQKTIDYLLVTSLGEVDHKLDVLQEIAAAIPVLIEAADEKMLDELLELPISGIALRGVGESRPGLMDYETLSAILERLEVDE